MKRTYSHPHSVFNLFSPATLVAASELPISTKTSGKQALSGEKDFASSASWEEMNDEDKDF